MVPGIEPDIAVRLRAPRDLDAVERIARVVHTTDGYPVYVPDDDLRAFVVAPEALTAWVATRHEQIVGHVALHASSSSSVMELAASVTRMPVSALAVVARLLVDPEARRSGVASGLLRAAVEEARARDRVPILDVMSEHRDAIAMYEASGWTLLGTVTVSLPTGPARELVYLAPPAP